MEIFENSTAIIDNSSSLNLDYVNTASLLMTVKYISLIRVYLLHPIGILGSVLTVLIISRSELGFKSYKCCIMVIATADGIRLIFTSIRLISNFMLWPVTGWFCRIHLSCFISLLFCLII